MHSAHLSTFLSVTIALNSLDVTRSMIDSFLGRQWTLCWPSGVTMEHMPHLRADGYLSVALCMHASQYECPQKRRRGRRMVLKALPQSWQQVAARSSPPAVSSPSRTTAPLSASELTRSGGARLSLCEYPDELRSKSRCSGSPTSACSHSHPYGTLYWPSPRSCLGRLYSLLEECRLNSSAVVRPRQLSSCCSPKRRRSLWLHPGCGRPRSHLPRCELAARLS